jgi:RNA polymerase sigma factor (sigma-70 family)
MPSYDEEIKAEIEHSLKCLAGKRGEEIINKIRPVIYTNLQRGRVRFFIEGEIHRVREYVWRVAEIYSELYPLVSNLQNNRATSKWKPLSSKMYSWAYSYFLGKGFHPSGTTREIAMECANEAAAAILQAYFPYDTGFDPWACVIVQNTCRKYIRRETKKAIIPQQNLVEIDEALSNIPDPAYQDKSYLADLREDLDAALTFLPEARRQVIELCYFDGLSPAEIAKRMGKSLGAVHCLKFNALQDLRKILSKNGYKLNE